MHVHEFGPGEAASMTGLKLEDGEMIAADIFANQMTPFVIEGRMLKWIDQLAGFHAALPEVTRVYPGHGNSSSAAALVDAQSAYLTGFRDLVRESVDSRSVLTEDARARVVAEVEQRYPGYLPVAEMPGLLAMSADAIACELAQNASPARR